MLSITRTPPFKKFQEIVGNATFHINQITVGLELVARGGVKPAELHIKWDVPKHPRESADQARQFVLLAIVANVVESFDRLLRDYAQLDWFHLEVKLRDILLKAVKKSGSEDYSIHERAEELVRYLKIDEAEKVSFLELMVSWRNALVHSSRPKLRLSAKSEDRLKMAAPQIASRYADIDVDKMLLSFAARRRPTLKEATTMVAVSQNLARSLDVAIVHACAGQADKIELIARLELTKHFQGNEAYWKKIWGRDTEGRMRALTNLLAGVGITNSKKAVSAELDANFVRDIASSTMLEIRTLFGSETA